MQAYKKRELIKLLRKTEWNCMYKPIPIHIFQMPSADLLAYSDTDYSDTDYSDTV